MDDNEFKLRREVKELKGEVRRLNRMVNGLYGFIGLVAVILFPRLIVGVGVLILFAFLVSPVRGMIFSSLFQKQNKSDYET